MVFTLDLFIFSNRNVHSGVDCNTIKVAYDYSHSNKLLGFGGLLGHGAPGCPPNFYPIGKDCINLPIQSASLFENMESICKTTFGPDSSPYTPSDQVQNAIFQGYMNWRNGNVIQYS